MNKDLPVAVAVPAGEVWEWDCPHCGKSHKTVLKPPGDVLCTTDWESEVRLVALPVKPRR